MARRKPTAQERLTPCWCCGYPISQKHHILGYAEHGKNEISVQLCANCHEAYHILKSHQEKATRRNTAVANSIPQNVWAKLSELYQIERQEKRSVLGVFSFFWGES